MSTIKPLKLYFLGPSPNPWKVVIILEELKLPYDLVKVDDVKSPGFLKINPNGRVPALEDPNTGVKTWESGSVIEYLLATYDTAATLSYTSSPEKFEQNNWKHFQMSGQGPYFGQKGWFSNYHPEKLPSAIERYEKEIRRVLGVIELRLSTTGQAYLVGSKATFADLMFVPWNSMLIGFMLGDFEEEFKASYPKTYAWHQSLVSRDSVKTMMEKRSAYIPK